MCLAIMLPTLTFVACGEDDPIVEPPVTPDKPVDPNNPELTEPAVALEVGEIQQTSATFILTTDKASEYVYLLSKEAVKHESPAELFQSGTVMQFDQSHKAIIKLENLEAECSYNLYAATRYSKDQQNLFSTIAAVEFNTTRYVNVLTLNKADYTSYTYHVQIPAGKKYKHISARKADFDWIINLVGGNATTYTNAFGFSEDKPGDFSFDKYFEDIYGGPVNIYPGDEYIVFASELDSEGACIEATTRQLIIQTPACPQSPYKIGVHADEINSTNAVITITPDKEFKFFRWTVLPKKDFDHIAQEGEGSVRADIIGNWNEKTNEANKQTTLEIDGLKPNTEYIAGVIGFDQQSGMTQVMFEFTTAEPSGPKPIITITDQDVPDPYNSKAFQLLLQNTISGTIDLHTKAQYDDVLSRPDVQLKDVVRNNGTYMEKDQLNTALSEHGLKILFENLKPETEYVFGVYAENEESVSVVDTVQFTTDKTPNAGQELRQKLLGKYTAKINTYRGGVRTFPVEIKKGVNAATEAEYESKNRLVCLGLGLDNYPIMSPETLMEDGQSEEEANLNYGPKWFIEFQPDGTISTPKVYDYELDYNVYNYRGSKLEFHGFANRDGDYIDTRCPFPIEVSADYNTITVKGYEMTSEWTGQTFTYYPGPMVMTSAYSGDPIWIGLSELVLERDPVESGAVYSTRTFAKKMSLPQTVKIDLSDCKTLNDVRTKAMQKMH